ncbi:MAG: hypothetical protein EOO26_05040 [Comamonadaceae bacterium]|nr:MAG: hypothetical protein EOO26_05040 [Comamonadaceae bacterium]
MNHVYRTVFNRARGIYQVASELARNSGGSGSTSSPVVGAAPAAGGCGSAPDAFRMGALQMPCCWAARSAAPAA